MRFSPALARAALLGMLALGCGHHGQDSSSSEHAAGSPTSSEGGGQPPARAGSASGAVQSPASDRVARWRGDLRELADELPRRHKNLFFHVSEADFRAAVDELDHRLATASDEQIVVGLMRLVAMVGDGHTALDISPVATTYFPLALYWFSDGIFVVDAPPDQHWAVGRELVAVDGHPLQKVIDALAPLVSRDNDAQLHAQLPELLIRPLVLAGSGLTDTRDSVSYQLRGPDGATRDLQLSSGPRLGPAPLGADAPLYLQKRQMHFWNTYVAKDRLLYLQYNVCADSPQLPFARFASGTLAFADQHPVDRFVIDLRFNGGGNSEIIRPLIDGLAAHPKLAGHIYVIIGRSTFSSALLNAMDLHRRVGAVLVGEPTGGKPSHYGEVKSLVLPSSRLKVFYSTNLFSNPEFPGDSLQPEIRAELSSADFFAGRDPALEAVLASPHR